MSVWGTPVLVRGKGHASGAIASFPDGDGSPVRDMTIKLEPVQDLHGYDSPWPAGGGVNIVPKIGENNTYIDVSVSYDSDAEIYTLNGTANEIGNISLAIIPKNDLKWVENEPYTISCRVISGNFTIPSGSGNTYALSIFNSGYSKFIRGAVDLSESGLDGYSVTGNAFTTTSSFNVMIQAFRSGMTFNNLKVKIQIEKGSTATAWTPYSNICPISGWTGCNVQRTGKNLVDITGIPYTATTQTFDVRDKPITFPVFMSIHKSSDFAASSNVWEAQAVLKDGTMQYAFPDYVAGTGAIQATPENPLVSISCRAVYMTAGSYDIQLELGSTPTAYSPYTGTTYPITFPTPPGTVYGGTLDVTTGVLTVDRKMVDLGTLEWLYAAPIFYVLINDIKPPAEGTQVGNIICSRYKPVSRSAMANNGEISLSTNKYINVIDNAYIDTATFKTAMSGVQLVYELATPVTYQLDPVTVQTLAGQNVMWADSGDVTVKYLKGTFSFLSSVII